MIEIKDFCKQLNSSPEEKLAFLQECVCEKFLKPFEEYNVLNFSKNTDWAEMKYLKAIKNEENKDIIFKIINKNFQKPTDMSFFGMEGFIELLKLFSFDEIEKNTEKESLENIFKADSRLLLTKYLLEQNGILNFSVLSFNCIKHLIEYKEHKTYFGVLKIFPVFGFYDTQEVLTSAKYNTNLFKILKNEKICDFLYKEYNKITKATEEISVLDKQYIKDNFDNSKESYDTRSIILDFLAVYYDDNDDKTEFLLKNENLMLQKLGLYLVSQNFEKFRELFCEYFSKAAPDLIFKLKYEILSVFEQIDNGSKNKNIISAIQEKLKEIKELYPKHNSYFEYMLLHGLKNNPEFQSDFIRLKEKHNNLEIPSVKLFFDKNESVAVVREGAKEVKINNIEKYLNNEELKNISDENHISEIFQEFREKICDFEIKTCHWILDVINYYIEQKIYKKSKQAHYLDIKTSELLIEISGKNNPELKLKINQILDKLININYKKTDLSNDITYSAAASTLSLYLKAMFINDFENVEKKCSDILKKDENSFFGQIHSYYLGYFYQNIKKKSDPPSEMQKAFCEGLCNNFVFGAVLEKKDILKKNIKHLSDIPRTNLIYGLVNMRFAFARNIDEFTGEFDNDLKNRFLKSIIYPARKHYDKDKVFEFLKEEIKNKCNNPALLLQIFNEYCSDGDIFKYYKEIVHPLFELYEQESDSSDQLSEFQDFIANFERYYLESSENINKTDVYNVLWDILSVAKYYDVYYTNALSLKNILEKFKKDYGAKGENDIQSIVIRICKTRGFASFSNWFQEFIN